MARSANQKLKLLYLVRILRSETDEQHPKTVAELIAALERYGIKAERKSMYDDIEALQTFGLDIVASRGKSNQYYLGGREFQLAELKLLVDAAQSAKFITAKKSGELIRKISSLTSRHEAALLHRQVHVQGRVKTMNESIYYNVDILHAAIVQNRKIHFQYYEWAVAPQSPRLFERRWRRGGKPYLSSPWALVWDNENYYLLACDAGGSILKHYRVDKMAAIQVTEEAREGREVYEALDIAEYTKHTFGMFGGRVEGVRLRFANHLIGVVVDRFGKDIIIHQAGEGHFTVNITARISPQFFSWVYGFGSEAEILAPAEVVQEMRRNLAAVAGLYGEGEA